MCIQYFWLKIVTNVPVLSLIPCILYFPYLRIRIFLEPPAGRCYCSWAFMVKCNGCWFLIWSIGEFAVYQVYPALWLHPSWYFIVIMPDAASGMALCTCLILVVDWGMCQAMKLQIVVRSVLFFNVLFLFGSWCHIISKTMLILLACSWKSIFIICNSFCCIIMSF